jgi:hypothetical protein
MTIGNISDYDQVSKKFPSRVSRAEMEKYEHLLPEHVKREIKKGKLHYADSIIYSIKPIDSRTIKMFLPQDDKEIGLRNISNGKLQKNQCLLVSGIWCLCTTTYSGSTKDDLLGSAFMEPDILPPLVNGEFSLKANQDYIVHEAPCMVFRNAFPSAVGYYKLDNPRLIIDQVPIEFTIELGTMKNMPKNSFVMIGLKGTITTP